MVKRRTIAAAAIVVIVAATYQAWQTASTLHIGVAYKAKTVCSGVFVSRRDLGGVLAETEADDLAILRYVSTSVDPQAHTVTTSAAGLFRRRAAFRDGLGCTLVPGDAPLPASPLRSAPDDGLPDLDLPSDLAGTNGALAAVVERAFSEPNPERRRRTQAVVVVQHGRVIAERYAPGITPDTPLQGWSMTKCVLGALAGVLVGRGRLTLDAPVRVPEWKAPGDPRGEITLDHLLRMSSGLEFDEDVAGPRSDLLRMLFDAGDSAGLAVNKPLVAAPGTIWQYSSGTSNIIARVIRHAIGNDAEYLVFPRRALFDRVGMRGAVIETDAAGTFVASSHMYATARDWARFGMLYLQDGVWGGERILPEGWVAYTRTPAPADPVKRYGAHFWLKVPIEYCVSGTPVPSDAFHAAGHEAQFVTIVPSLDAVIVRLGRTRYPDAWDQCVFARDVLAALNERGE